MKHVFYAVIRVEVETDLDREDAIDEMNNDCRYDFPPTENIKEVSTEWMGNYDVESDDTWDSL